MHNALYQNFTDELGPITPLHRACLMNNSDLVAELLQDKTTDISATDKNGSTPLHYACQGGNKEIVELLILTANRLTSALHENDQIKSYFNLTDNHKVSSYYIFLFHYYDYYYYYVEYTTWFGLYKRTYRNS